MFQAIGRFFVPDDKAYLSGISAALSDKVVSNPYDFRTDNRNHLQWNSGFAVGKRNPDQPNPETNPLAYAKDPWYMRPLLWLIALYFVAGAFGIVTLFDSQYRTTEGYIFQALVVAPVWAMLVWRYVLKPIFFVARFLILFIIGLTPLIIIGFGLGIGIWLAFCIL